MIYLASPYSHTNEAVRELRFRLACRAAANLLRAGHEVFSPIAHGHAIAQCGLPLDWDYWNRMDRRQLERCGRLAVLMIDGWDRSRGVREETRLAIALRKPIVHLDPVWSLASVSDRKAGRSPTLAYVAKEAVP